MSPIMDRSELLAADLVNELINLSMQPLQADDSHEYSPD